MRGRFAPLTPPALLLAVLALLATGGRAQAHRLEAEYHVLPDRKVRIESWFDLTLTNDPPRGAQVRVLRADGTLLTEGRLDGDGTFTFPFEKAEPLRVVVTAGQGHHKELSIPADELARVGGAEKVPEAAAPGAALPEAARPATHATAVSIKDVLIGVGFLLALGAFVLSVRNARQLRRLRQTKEQSVGAPGSDDRHPEGQHITPVRPHR
jgi:hypothetical protein